MESNHRDGPTGHNNEGDWKLKKGGVIMARRAIPMIAFPRVRTIYIYYNYIYIILFNRPLTRVCVVYVVKEVTSFRGLGQLMGVARKRTRALALQTSRKKAV